MPMTVPSKPSSGARLAVPLSTRTFRFSSVSSPAASYPTAWRIVAAG